MSSTEPITHGKEEEKKKPGVAVTIAPTKKEMEEENEHKNEIEEENEDGEEKKSKSESPDPNDTPPRKSKEGEEGSPSSTTGSPNDEFKSYHKARKAFKKKDIAASRAEHKKQVAEHIEFHKGGASDYVKAIVFGGLDGIITTFAIVAAAAGAGHDWKVILVFGFANVLADAFSMGFGEYVSGNAERDFACAEREREEWEVVNCFDEEKDEMVDIYHKKGLSMEDSKTMVDIISKDPKVFVDFMMIDELNLLLDLEDEWESTKQGAVMFTSFVCFGVLPLLAYLGGNGEGTDYIFGISCAIVAVALLILGAIKGHLTSMSMLRGSALMLLNGTISGGASYGVGVLVEYIVDKSTD